MIGSQAANLALGAGIGCFATVFNINALNNHYDYTSAVLTTSTLMGGVGYCVGVLTGSSSPRIVAMAFAVVNLISCLCCDGSIRREYNSGYSFLWNMLSCTVPLATGMAFLTQHSFLNGYCASGVAISVIAFLVLPKLPVDACISGLSRCYRGVAGAIFTPRDHDDGYNQSYQKQEYQY